MKFSWASKCRKWTVVWFDWPETDLMEGWGKRAVEDLPEWWHSAGRLNKTFLFFLSERESFEPSPQHQLVTLHLLATYTDFSIMMQHFLSYLFKSSASDRKGHLNKNNSTHVILLSIFFHPSVRDAGCYRHWVEGTDTPRLYYIDPGETSTLISK